MGSSRIPSLNEVYDGVPGVLQQNRGPLHSYPIRRPSDPIQWHRYPIGRPRYLIGGPAPKDTIGDKQEFSA